MRVTEEHSLHGNLFVDDTQVIGSCPPRDVIALQFRVSTSLDDVSFWMRLNWLQLNTSKTELLRCATERRQGQLPCIPLRVGPHLVNPVSSVRDLGIYIDADLSGRTQVLKTTASCCAALRQLRSVRWCLPLAAYKSLIVSLVLSRLDYGNATLSGLPEYQFRRLQSVINAEARSIYNLRWSDHVTPALMELHWLSAVDRVNPAKIVIIVAFNLS